MPRQKKDDDQQQQSADESSQSYEEFYKHPLQDAADQAGSSEDAPKEEQSAEQPTE